jgi:predicted Fe-S protein YdhL (DUF1289 family)
MITPCIRLCTLDPADNVCVGCGRTLAEIGDWMRYSEAERQAIVDALPARLAARRAALAERQATFAVRQ